MQVCTRSERGIEMVFIIDLIRIAQLNLLKHLDSVLAPVLGDDNVIKLGHGLCLDFKELRESYPEMVAFHNVRHILDTTKMYRKLRPNDKKSISLKKLTKLFLHLNLIKAQTCSDWEIRPLSESQLHYCACDALVLLRLYDAMSFDAMDLFGESENAFQDITCDVYYSDSQGKFSMLNNSPDRNSCKRRKGSFDILETVSDISSNISTESDTDDYNICDEVEFLGNCDRRDISECVY